MKRAEKQKEIRYCIRQYLILVKIISYLAFFKGHEKNKVKVCLMTARDVFRDRIKELGPHKGIAANVLWALVGDTKTFPNREAIEGYLLPVKEKGIGHSKEAKWALYKLSQPRLRKHLKKGASREETRRLFNRTKKQVIRDYYWFWKERNDTR